ncbi:DoxX family protein [Altererythrobacter sp.]|uniref:DoxX family protein n=1 Tax=Altererythrobacter sp. TaxID=1872480 RepID=UPI001B0D0146|nr:DoxX family protein [Altererythrobacter sp.]MBO6610102.1 DoxX family protein [Altererythrobacter sp.]MBO6642728.1 DoxX family protein [Altererythrobacter sp.]MBO6708764.1 DoxX family protein [Altererythrobacter sp.]
MSSVVALYDRAVGLVANVIGEAFALLLARVALAGIFWRSYKTKVEEGTWLQINDTQYFLFEDQFSGLPIPTDLAVPMATYAEFLFPILLVLGLATRFSAVALLIMTLVIQIFVFPTSDHFFGWAMVPIALAAVLIARGSGMLSADAIVVKARGQ